MQRQISHSKAQRSTLGIYPHPGVQIKCQCQEIPHSEPFKLVREVWRRKCPQHISVRQPRVFVVHFKGLKKDSYPMTAIANDGGD